MAGRQPDLEYVSLRSLEKDTHDDDDGARKFGDVGDSRQTSRFEQM